MRKIYLSFLGLSNYSPAVYELNGKKAEENKFVQAAEMELLGASRFDLILIAATEKSYDKNFNELKSQMERFGASPSYLIIDEDMKPEGQWKWFENILAYIEKKDELTVDMTHGFRSIPIVFSAAINFLQKARDISLNAVYYGVFEKVRELGYAPVVDMKDFYLINEWADAVSRLVEDADARKMAKAAVNTSEFQIGELNDEDMIKTFEDLTNTVRNVDVNNVAEKANKAIKLIREKKKNASETGKILLDLVIEKFVSLTTDVPVSGKYDRAYFKVQLEIIRLLLEHKLFMQAYTVMREFIASMGMIPLEKVKVNNNDGRKKRHRFAEVFVSMVTVEENRWNFHGMKKDSSDFLKPFYDKLKEKGIENILKSFAKDMADYRNGFDHAWTSKAGAAPDIEKFGNKCFHKLEKVVEMLEENSLV